MRRARVFLCGVLTAALMTGCGSAMPDLTQEETDIISEYAVGVLLKYDKYHSGRLVDTSAYETAEENTEEETETLPEEEQPAAEESAEPAGTADEPEEAEAASATIEGYYGIPDFTFRYAGYDLTQSYPDGTEGEDLFFSMDATPGMELLVLHFTASNTSSADQTLDMLSYGAKFRISVNGGAGENALTTMLLDDMETYSGVVTAGSSTDLVSIVEVPQVTSVETIDFTLRGGEGNAVMRLQ